jgi:CheY-like chemotaxis protein
VHFLPASSILAHRYVLVVEDDHAVRELFSTALRQVGAEVAEAVDGLAALELVRGRLPDVVVTDVTMPRLDGIEFTRRLRRNSRTKDVPIIVVSGRAASGATADEARQAGCDVVMAKPCTIAALVSVVNEFADRRPAHLARHPTSEMGV